MVFKIGFFSRRRSSSLTVEQDNSMYKLEDKVRLPLLNDMKGEVIAIKQSLDGIFYCVKVQDREIWFREQDVIRLESGDDDAR